MYVRYRSPLFYHHRSCGGPHYRSWRYHHGPRHHRPSHCNQGYRVTEDEEALSLTLDVPGIKIDDLKVEVDDGVLHVSGKREGYPEVSKHFRVDTQSIDITRMEARLENGVLVLQAPKKTKPVAQAIPITESNPTDDTEAMQEEEIEVTLPEAEATVLPKESEETDATDGKESEVEVTTVSMEQEEKEKENDEWEEVE